MSDSFLQVLLTKRSSKQGPPLNSRESGHGSLSALKLTRAVMNGNFKLHEIITVFPSIGLC